MADYRLMPFAGIDNVREDAALKLGGDAPSLHVREAMNVDFLPSGGVQLRPGMRKVSETAFRGLWQSPLHGDVFGAVGDQWGRVDPQDWSFSSLVTLGPGELSHEVLNNIVAVAGDAGIFTFDGARAARLTIDTPAAPMVSVGDDGALPAGGYGVAVAWLRGAQESATSDLAMVDVPAGGRLSIVFPLVLDATITGCRLYLTRQNGGELTRAGDYPAGTQAIEIPVIPDPGAPASYRHLVPMPTGRCLKQWRGRLMTVAANILRFSEPLAYHLHNPRHGWVQLPQRISFVLPVESGIWVGQTDHVLFLQGDRPDSLTAIRCGAKAPVSGSGILLPAALLPPDVAGGLPAALWLADNGYVVGTATGQLVELQARSLRGLAASRATCVVLERRVLAAIG